MARYIDIQPIIDDLDRDIEILNKYRLQAKEDNRPDVGMMYARKIETVKAFNNLLKEQPTADVRPVVRGKWKSDGHGHIICTACNNANVSTWKSAFCPNCGAEMESEE